MKIFITGAGGFVGRQLLERLADDGRIAKIYSLCRRKTDALQSVVSVVEGSLETLGSTENIDADVCIHLAAVTNSAKTDDEEVFRVNEKGTAEVVAFCKRNNIGRIIFLSSVNVYLSEKQAYAKSKLAAEEHIKNSGLEYSIFRCSLVYGKGCQSFEKIIKTAKIFHIVPVAGNGKATEQPIYTDEVCDAVIDSIFYDSGNKICGLYGKTKMTYNEMVMKIADANGCRVKLLHLPEKPLRIIASVCYRNSLPFPMLPEQISHMGEDLGCDEYGVIPASAVEFVENRKKYIR